MHVTITNIDINRRAVTLPEFGFDIQGNNPDEIVSRALNAVQTPRAAFEFTVSWWEISCDCEPVARSAFGTVPKAGDMN